MTAVESPVRPLFRTPEGESLYRAAYDAVLRHWPIPYEEIDVPTRLGDTHVIASGRADGPPLLLLPSMAGSATLWRPNVAALGAEFRTYAVDVVGQAGKSHPARRIRGRDEFAGWLGDVMDRLGIARASIVGSSYGAFLAVNQAILAPDRVDRLVLIGPAGTFVGGMLRLLARALLRSLLQPRKERGITDLLGDGATLDPADEPWGDLMKIVIDHSARPNLVTPAVFGRRELERVEAPTLLLIGERERLYDPAKALRRAAKRMPAIRGRIIPGAHHLAALAKPEEVNRLMLDFLTEGEGTERGGVPGSVGRGEVVPPA